MDRRFQSIERSVIKKLSDSPLMIPGLGGSSFSYAGAAADSAAAAGQMLQDEDKDG